MITFAKTPFSESAERKPAPFRPAVNRLAPAAYPAGPLLQRKPACACGGGCPRCQQPSAAAGLQADAQAAPATAAGDAPALPQLSGLRDNMKSRPAAPVSYLMTLGDDRRQSLTGGGQTAILPEHGTGRPLSSSEELALGNADGALDGVRIHDDRSSRMTASLLGSAGFTIGKHIVLGEPAAAGRSPGWLLAHEAAHTIQQRKAGDRAPAQDAEGEADAFANQVTRSPGGSRASLGAAPTGFAQKVIARTTQDLPGDLMLIVDVDDGDFVGGCVKEIVPHVGAKLIMKGVPKGAGNQIFNIHIGMKTNAKGELCVFFYESVSGLCELLCFKDLDELKKKLKEIQEWLEEKIKQVLEALAITLAFVLVAVLAYLIALALVAALGGILVLA